MITLDEARAGLVANRILRIKGWHRSFAPTVCSERAALVQSLFLRAVAMDCRAVIRLANRYAD